MSEHSRNDEALLLESNLFDDTWYSDQFQDVALSGMEASHHYLHYGHLLGRNPSPSFDAQKYLAHNDDVARNEVNPLLHFLKHGKREGRLAYPFLIRDEDRPYDPLSLISSLHLFEPEELPDELGLAIMRDCGNARVSVVMPTWNRRDVIGRALRSAFSQTLSPHEVIVTDDGSTDGTLEMLNTEFADEVAQGKLILLSGSRGGVSHARNQGLERATGDFIAYLDSDNEWHPDHLLYAAGVLLLHPDRHCAYTAIRVNHAGVGEQKVLGRRYDRSRLLRGNYIDLNAFVHRREVYTRLGGFDRSLRRLVDWDLIIRYTEDVDPFHIPVVTVEYYLDAESLGNITYTERIGPARDTIFVKHRDEYLARGILTNDAIERANACLLAAAASAEETRAIDSFNVVLASEGAQSLLPDLRALDVGVTVWLNRGRRYRVLSSSVPGIVQGGEVDAFPSGAYWCPDLTQPLPQVDQLRALYMAVATGSVDLGVVSYSLATSGDIATACLRNQVVVTDRLVKAWLAPDRDLRLGGLQGKILRIPPAPDGSLFNVAVTSLLGPDVVIEPKNLLLREKSAGLNGQLRRRDSWPAPTHAKRKPVVLILPMKVAVGGVERNTVEIMRALRDRYDFIYLTMEKIHPEQGSLAAQVMDVAHRFIDLAEISTPDHYIDLLRTVKSTYAPDVVWICNGSMWMCKHAPSVREVFSDVPIVDQQVYDVTEGWIRRYTEPGIQSFDRFIAINSKIRERFINEFRMDPAHVDLIYSAIDSDKFRQRKRELGPPEMIRQKYGFPGDSKLFAFMGRLVDQKRPLDFLEIAARRSRENAEHFILVGNGVLAPQVEQWLHEHPDVSAQWIPYIENTAEFWSVMDGMVVTSAYEGLPIAMLEALAMEVPVVSTDVGDIAPVLSDHNGGVIVDRIGDPEAFAVQMDRFVADLADFRERLVHESERVLDRFSSRAIAQRYHECWQTAIAGMVAEEGALS